MNIYLTELSQRARRWHIPAGIASALVGVAAAQTWIEDSPADEDVLIWFAAHLTVMCLVLWPLIHIFRTRLRQWQARRIAGKLLRCGRSAIPMAELSRVLGIKNADVKIQNLIRKGYLQNLETDGLNLILCEPAPEEDAVEPEPDGDDVIARIRRLNDEIDDAAVSERIDRIEQITASILRTLEDRPDRADDARRFMNYYLPTTLKLLESYRLMEKQSFQGENIQLSRRRIEEVLDKIVIATQKQQDKLFRSEALDVEAEISVLETMMASDGLAGTQGRPA